MSPHQDLCKLSFDLEIRGAVPLSSHSKSLTLNCLEAPVYLSSDCMPNLSVSVGTRRLCEVLRRGILLVIFLRLL